jgi:uncharacterized protein (DUF433 family)
MGRGPDLGSLIAGSDALRELASALDAAECPSAAFSAQSGSASAAAASRGTLRASRILLALRLGAANRRQILRGLRQRSAGELVDLPEYIEIRPGVMMGKPCLKGTRIPVHLILEKLAGGETAEQILSAYTQLRQEHIAAALAYAAKLASDEIVLAS